MHRGAGLGTRVLREMESQARSLGATCAFLDTFTFQAAPFYAKNGYVVGYWGGHDRIYMAKCGL